LCIEFCPNGLIKKSFNEERVPVHRIPHRGPHIRFEGNKGRPGLRWIDIDIINEDIASHLLALIGAIDLTNELTT